MFDFFTWLWNMVLSLVTFLLEVIKGLLRLIELIPVAVTALTTSVGYLPSILAAFAAATITISVIFILAGRESGGQK